MAAGYYRTMTGSPIRRLIWTGGTIAAAVLSFLIYQLVFGEPADAFVAFIASYIPVVVWLVVVPFLHRRWSRRDAAVQESRATPR